MKSYKTKEDAAHAWVNEMNAHPTDMISLLMDCDVFSWHEITLPTVGEFAIDTNSGEEVRIASQNEDGEFVIEFESGDTDVASADQLDVIHDDMLPMWGTMWSFGDSADDEWVHEGGLEIMSALGFRVYEHDDWGIFFGIDGAGYDFYEAHWIPLYEKRGLKWHEKD